MLAVQQVFHPLIPKRLEQVQGGSKVHLRLLVQTKIAVGFTQGVPDQPFQLGLSRQIRLDT